MLCYATILHCKTILGREQPELMRWILLWIIDKLNYFSFAFLGMNTYYINVMIYLYAKHVRNSWYLQRYLSLSLPSSVLSSSIVVMVFVVLRSYIWYQPAIKTMVVVAATAICCSSNSSSGSSSYSRNNGIIISSRNSSNKNSRSIAKLKNKWMMFYAAIMQ